MTMGFRLTLRKRPDGRLALSVPVFYRALLGGIGVLILLAVILTAPEGERRLFAPGNAVPLIICALSLLGAAYNERWLFDRPGDAVIHRVGLGIFRTTRRYRLSDMAALELEGARGNPRLEQAGGLLFRRKGPILTLWLAEKEEKAHRLETYSPAQAPRAAETARTIAEYCQLALRAE
jgi:hypothetical protein